MRVTTAIVEIEDTETTSPDLMTQQSSLSRRTLLSAPSDVLVKACDELDQIAMTLPTSFGRARARLRLMTPTPISRTSSE